MSKQNRITFNTNRYLKQKMTFFHFFCVFVSFFLVANVHGEKLDLQKLDLQKVEELIFIKCNLKRKKYHLPPYEYSIEFAQVAKYHSSNMIIDNFFSHTDRKRRSPQDRVDEFYPEMIAGVGENIAINFGYSEEELADNLVEAWMNSPGHRANILSKKYNYLGNGVVVDSDRSKANIDQFYATQKFGILVARFTGESSINFKYLSEIRLPFQFLGKHPKDELSIYISYPNKNYKHYIKSSENDYRYYTGGGTYKPHWINDNEFEIHLKLDKGKGNYFITMGRNNRFYLKAIVVKTN